MPARMPLTEAMGKSSHPSLSGTAILDGVGSTTLASPPVPRPILSDGSDSSHVMLKTSRPDAIKLLALAIVSLSPTIF